MAYHVAKINKGYNEAKPAIINSKLIFSNTVTNADNMSSIDI
jgi:hypothetical protein